MQVGSLIIYDHVGRIWVHIGDSIGVAAKHPVPNGLPYIQTQFGELDGKRVLSVDVTVTPHKLITEDIIVQLTPEQQQIQELENQLLTTQEQLINQEYQNLLGGI